jgi:hypothetical protein
VFPRFLPDDLANRLTTNSELPGKLSLQEIAGSVQKANFFYIVLG